MDTTDDSIRQSTKRRQRRMDSPASARVPFADDKRFIQSCQNGDRDSQRQLYEQHCQQVYRLMYRMVGERHADDLTQQVFLHVLQNLSQFSGRSAFSTWLYRLATNEALQFLRRNDRPTQPNQSMTAHPIMGDWTTGKCWSMP